MRVLFVGGHCVGKSSIASHTAKHYGLKLLPEVARTELAKIHPSRSFDQLRNDIKAVSEYQRRVFAEQVRVEKEAGDNYVSDRAIDNLAYFCANGEGVADLIKSAECREYANQMSESLVFFVRPLAKLEDDGVRAKGDLDMASVWRIDGMVQLLLDLFDIKYIPVSCHAFKDRWTLVKGVTDLYKAGICRP